MHQCIQTTCDKMPRQLENWKMNTNSGFVQRENQEPLSPLLWLFSVLCFSGCVLGHQELGSRASSASLIFMALLSLILHLADAESSYQRFINSQKASRNGGIFLCHNSNLVSHAGMLELMLY